MSQKRKNQRAKHEEREKQNAEKVIRWIFAILVILALAYAVYTTGLIG